MSSNRRIDTEYSVISVDKVRFGTGVVVPRLTTAEIATRAADDDIPDGDTVRDTTLGVTQVKGRPTASSDATYVNILGRPRLQATSQTLAPPSTAAAAVADGAASENIVWTHQVFPSSTAPSYLSSLATGGWFETDLSAAASGSKSSEEIPGGDALANHGMVMWSITVSWEANASGDRTFNGHVADAASSGKTYQSQTGIQAYGAPFSFTYSQSGSGATLDLFIDHFVAVLL